MSLIDRIINNIIASMSMEGLFLSEEDIERLKECLTGSISYEDAISLLIEYYTKQEE